MLQAVLGDDETFLEAEQRAALIPGGRRTAEQAVAELTVACGLGPSDWPPVTSLVTRTGLVAQC